MFYEVVIKIGFQVNGMERGTITKKNVNYKGLREHFKIVALKI